MKLSGIFGGILAAFLVLGIIAGGRAAGQQHKAQKPASAPASGGAWVSATGNVGGDSWGYGGVCTLMPVPGSGTVLAGVSQRGVWATDTGGAIWKPLGTAGQINNRPYQILFDPKDPKTFWESGNNSVDGVYKTIDGGQTFVMLGDMPGTDGISVDFTDPYRRTIVVAQHHHSQSLWVTVSSGAAWRAIGAGIPMGTGNNSDVLALDDNTFLCNASAGSGAKPGIFRSWDGGKNWIQVCAEGPIGIPLVASNGAIFWRDGANGQPLKSTNKGMTWKLITCPVRTSVVEALPGLLVGAGDQRLYSSRDWGSTWSAFGPPLPYRPFGVIYSPAQGYFIWSQSASRVPFAIYRWRPS